MKPKTLRDAQEIIACKQYINQYHAAMQAEVYRGNVSLEIGTLLMESEILAVQTAFPSFATYVVRENPNGNLQ